SEVPLDVDRRQGICHGAERLRAGDRRLLSLSLSEDAPAVVPPLGEHAHLRIERSIAWWQEWAAVCTYRGPYRDQVLRSALALKLITYAPSGAVVAAPTTSRPERVG